MVLDDQTRLFLLGQKMQKNPIHQVTTILNLLGVIVFFIKSAVSAQDTKFSGVGWVQYGQVVHSTDTMITKYSGNPIQNSGAQLSLVTQISSNLVGAVGLGVYESHPMVGDANVGGRVPFSIAPYIAEARFTYQYGPSNDPKFSLTAGYFHYHYNSNNKNLGLYLLRGPLRPNIVISGFETKDVLPIANILGAMSEFKTGPVVHTLILNSETEYQPYFDISTAYIAQLRVSSFLKMGLGLNLVRIWQNEPKLSSQTYNDETKKFEPGSVSHPYEQQYIYVDSISNGTSWILDTTVIGYQGTKVMGNAEIDLKKLLRISHNLIGPEDLKWYAEIAVLGLENSKPYRKLYGEIWQRTPIMMGFNFPTFGLLNHLSLEVEYYGSPFKDDLSRYNIGQSKQPSPLPQNSLNIQLRPSEKIDPVTGDTTFVLDGTNIPYEQVNINLAKNNRGDDWKWSIHGAKTIYDHFKLSFQIANDHFRPGGTTTRPTREAILTKPADWYWMTKIAYFF